jgi:hypothetical protein
MTCSRTKRAPASGAWEDPPHAPCNRSSATPTEIPYRAKSVRLEGAKMQTGGDGAGTSLAWGITPILHIDAPRQTVRPA